MKLELIYTEAHNHIREIDRNRNQIINFYLLTIGAYLTIFKDYKYSNSAIFILVSILLLLYGIKQATNLVEHRKWHTRYSNTARLISRLEPAYEQQEGKIRTKAIASFVEHMYKDILYEDFRIDNTKDLSILRYIQKKYWRGTEYNTYNAFLLLTCIPLGTMTLIYFPKLLQVWISPIIGLLLLIILYILILNWLAAKKMFNDYDQGKKQNEKIYKLPFPCATWLLEGAVKSDQIFSRASKNKRSNC